MRLTIDGRGDEPEEVLFEIIPVGRALRVAAIDPRTNIEVVVCGPAGQGTEVLKRIAMRKLVRRSESLLALRRR